MTDVKPASLSAPVPDPVQSAEQPVEASPSPEMEALLMTSFVAKKRTGKTDEFWDQAAQKLGTVPVNPDVISLEEARKLGIIPDGN